MKTVDHTSSRDDGSATLCRDMKVRNSLGLHARPAALFVKTASAFDAEIQVERDGNTVSGKSIMGLMTLQAECGTVLRVSARGRQAKKALDHLEQLFKGKFSESYES